MIPVAIASFLLLIAVAYLIGRPFVAPLRYEREASIEQLLADRERLRAQLRELDMDFETGKLARDDYERIRARRLQQIETTTHAIHDAEPAEAEPRPTVGVDAEELERRVAARKRVLAELEVRSCPGCAHATDTEDRFCRRCGADLATTAETR
jgi:hypothetical protein